MAVYFLDSSALVKRYVQESGSAWVHRLMHPTAGNDIHIVRLTGVEVVAAIARQGRVGSLPASGVAAALAQFRNEFTNAFRIVEVTPAIVTRAMALAEAHGIRAYDAVQLAAALEVHSTSLALGLPVTLVSADTNLNTAAVAEGLAVEDPNTHP